MSGKRWTALRTELDGLSQSAVRSMQRTHFTTHVCAAVQRFLWTPALVLGCWVIVQVLSRLLQSEALQSGWFPWLLAALVVFALRIVNRVFVSRSNKVDRAHAIGEWDLQLHLADRLTAADDFLHLDQRSAFMQAAVEDAAVTIERTRLAKLHFESQRLGGPALLVMPVLAVLVLLVSGSLAGDWRAKLDATPSDVTVQLPSSDLKVDALPESEPQPHVETPPEKHRDQQAAASDRTAVAETRAYAAEVEEKSKESEGKTGDGRSAAAESSTGAGSSQGTPSQQGQISKPGKEKTKAKRKPAGKQKPHKQEDVPKKNDELESGATAGRGSSRGSNRNPASSDWSSKDHVNTPDDDNLEDEEEAEDEEEEQEARGGVQPSLRDRRPPVSRDLMIGFGNQPNPDSNGRSGPSQPKKSRGTASLVLGVPIPDRVKGQPNPGKTKITQERVQPKSEPAIAVDAESRQKRVALGSALQRQELEPWMRSLVREYFLAQRQKVKKP